MLLRILFLLLYLTAVPLSAQVPPPPGSMPNGAPMMMPSILDTSYQSVIQIRDGKLTTQLDGIESPYSIIGKQLRNQTDDSNTLTVFGKSSAVTVKNVAVASEGDGSNDFLAKGAAMLVAEGMLLLDNVQVTTNGVIASAVVAAEGATLKAVNSRFVSHGGALPADYVPVIGPGMKTPPSPLGITGTARTHLTMSNAHSYFYHCEFIADGWGALSTDAAGGDAYLEVNDSRVLVNNSGYGTYADFGARVVINRTEIQAATYTGVIAGAAILELNDSTTVADENVVMIHSVMGDPLESGELIIRGGEHKSKGTAILVKSANADILLSDTQIEAQNGELILARVNDDPMRTQVNNVVPPGSHVRVTNSSLRGDVINRDTERALFLQLGQGSHFFGSLQNVELALDATSNWTALSDSKVSAESIDVVNQITVKKGVTVTLRVSSANQSDKTITTAQGGKIIITGEHI
ncbi:hypothetical protein FJ444_13235 [Aestuariibacter sp. GS-14]|uniref:hypothetical protein n=1 Tax=Aestuariibacter sp. GS-14 TaxID=2590670 RepID=UPI001129F918|nr:hypothetical protein [Aestuariibacter sp. GS-14]TPV57352.1 hypothetical protein FJ444_13235 [Aestuariibacter sp. GS-14]